MSPGYDVAIVGLGIMGSAIAHAAVESGRRVFGADQSWPANHLGASGGESRLIRRAYGDFPEYASLTGEALAAWRRLEEVAGFPVFVHTGGLTIAPRGSAILGAEVASAKRHGVAYHQLTGTDLRQRYPVLRFQPESEAFVDEEAGILLADDCIRAFHMLAVAKGAVLSFGARVDLWKTLRHWRDHHTLFGLGARVVAESLILALGPWAKDVADVWGAPTLTLERTVSHWLSPGQYAAALGPAQMPVVTWHHGGDEVCMVPVLGGGRLKVKFHHTGEVVASLADLRPAEARDRTRLATYFRAASGLHLRHAHAEASVYTNTPTRRFELISDPGESSVLLVAACSGHGFKFAPLLGKLAVAKLAALRDPVKSGTESGR